MKCFHNVPGCYSSSNGNDFKEVLSEIVKIKDAELSVPMPEKNKWLCAGEIMGDGFSVAWRTLDAQFWGVAQRRRRCYLVADFDGERAGEILFKSEGLSGYTPPGCGAGQGAADHAQGGIGEPGRTVLNDQGGSSMSISENVTGSLRAEEHGHPPLVFEPGAASRLGGHAWHDVTGALRADMGDNLLAVAIEKHRPRAYGIGSFESNAMKSPNPHSGYYEADTSRTIDVSGGNPACNQGGIAVCDTPEHYTITTGSFTQICKEQAATLQARDYKDPQCVNQPRYSVRRLMPRECALLQGFPADWWLES